MLVGHSGGQQDHVAGMYYAAPPHHGVILYVRGVFVSFGTRGKRGRPRVSQLL